MRSRRWLIALALLAVLILAALWLVGRLLQPERLTPILLTAIGDASGLVLSVSEPADYALRPAPRLRLHGVRATAPGSSDVLLQIGLLDVELPWQTLFGGEPVVSALAITDARLHVAALQAWLQQRDQNASSTWPTLRSGLRISNSTIIGEGWRLQIDDLGLSRFALGEATTLTLAGHVLRERSSGESDWPARLIIDTVISHDDVATVFKPLTLALDAASPLPTLHANGELTIAAMMQFSLTGELAQWPAHWPALPGTDPAQPLAFVLQGRGAEPLTMALSASLEQAQTRLQLHVVPAQLQAWLASEQASPLPPLSGELYGERMMIDGNELQGVEIRVQADTQP